MIKLRLALSIGLAALVFSAWGGPAEGFLGQGKILSPDLVRRLESGPSTVGVIVLLEGYKDMSGLDFKGDLNLKRSLQAAAAAAQEAVLAALDPSECQVKHRFKNILGFSAQVSREGLEALAASEGVAVIEEDKPVHPATAQGVPQMNPGSHRDAPGGGGVAVAIVDTGIDYTHPALGGGGFPNAKVIGGYDFGDEDADPLDCEGHGTACAGIAAGTNTGVGDYIGGVVPEAKLYALKITAGCGSSSSTSTIAAAWDWCLSHQNDDPNNPIVVISTSFGGGYYTVICDEANPSLAVAAGNAKANGMAVFVSSGNEGYCEALATPACVSDAVSVGAVYDADISGVGFCVEPESCVGQFYWDCESFYACWDTTTAQDQVACYSNSAAFLDLLGPSHNAYVPQPASVASEAGVLAAEAGYTDSFGGTSAACPYAAGAAALIQSYFKQAAGDFLSVTNLTGRMIVNGDLIADAKSNLTTARVNIAQAIASSGGDRALVEAFVTRLYQQCLEREPDSSGLDHWVNSLLEGRHSGEAVARGFFLSVEFENRNLSDGVFVTILYRALFDREPDQAGYDNWVGELAAGKSREWVLSKFSRSVEFVTLCRRYGIQPY